MIEYGEGNLRIPRFLQDVYIVGCGMTDSRRFYYQKHAAELTLEAIRMAVVDGLGMSPREFKRGVNFVIHSQFADHMSDQLLFASVIHAALGFDPLGNIEIKTGGATGGSSVLAGSWIIASGYASLVPIIGLERMDEVDEAQGNNYIVHASDADFEREISGGRYTALYGLMNKRYMHKKQEMQKLREALAKIAHRDHYYAQFSPYTQQPGNYPPERIMKAKPIADPITPYECCAMGVGATCLILADKKTAFQLTDRPVRIAGIASGSDTLRTADRRNHPPLLLPHEDPSIFARFEDYPGFTSFRAARMAAYLAYHMAGIKNPTKDFDFGETHTAFSISDLQTFEDIGLTLPGHGMDFVNGGDMYHEGRLPINLSGGLIGGTHAVGQTGIWQLAHAFWQIRGEWAKFLADEKYWHRFGKRKPQNFRDLQIKKVKRGFVISHAGTGSHVVFMIPERGWNVSFGEEESYDQAA